MLFSDSEEGYVQAQDTLPLPFMGNSEYDPEDPKSLPMAVQVEYKDLSIRASPQYPGSKLSVQAPLGSFWVPRSKSFVQYKGTRLTFFEIEFQDGEALKRGWLLSYSPHEKQTLLKFLRSAPQGFSPGEELNLGQALGLLAESEVAPKGEWYEGHPKKDRLPSSIEVIGKNLTMRHDPEYPGQKMDLYAELGWEGRPLEHREFLYKGGWTSSSNTVINFYRVEVKSPLFDKSVQGWLLDYSPGESKRTLKIKY